MMILHLNTRYPEIVLACSAFHGRTGLTQADFAIAPASGVDPAEPDAKEVRGMGWITQEGEE